MDIDEVKQRLKEEWPEGPMLTLCLGIVDYIGRVPADELRMLTFTSLKNAVGLDEINDDLLKAISVLAGSSSHVLDSHLLLVDDDETEHELEKSDLAEAEEHGVLIHPETGERVENYKEKIIPYFVPTEEFFELRKGRG